MNGNTYRKQTGVVLVFSLLILLLVTLLGVNMVQQNRIQFLMAGNAQQQSTTFASAEDVLRLVENYIDKTRYTTWPIVAPPVAYPDPSYTCNKTASASPKLDQIKPADITNTIGLSATAIAAGVVAKINTTSCLLTGGIEVECIADTSQASGWDVNEINCNQNTATFCPTEVYTISVTVTNETGSKKEIESKYAVRCDV